MEVEAHAEKIFTRRRQHDLPEYSLSPFRILLPAQGKTEIGREGVPPAVPMAGSPGFAPLKVRREVSVEKEEDDEIYFAETWL